MQNYITKDLAFENVVIQKNDAKKVRISGYGNVKLLDLHGDVLTDNAFKNCLNDHKKKGTMPLMYHEHTKPVKGGRWTKVVEDACGLRVEGELEKNVCKETDQLIDQILIGKYWGLSIGFKVNSCDIQEIKGIRYIKNVTELIEISVVKTPANPYSFFVTDQTVAYGESARCGIFNYNRQ